MFCQIIGRISPSDLPPVCVGVLLAEIIVGFYAPFLFATKTWVSRAQSQQFGLEEVKINQHPGFPRTFQQQLLCKYSVLRPTPAVWDSVISVWISLKSFSFKHRLAPLCICWPGPNRECHFRFFFNILRERRFPVDEISWSSSPGLTKLSSKIIIDPSEKRRENKWREYFVPGLQLI